MEPLPPPLLLAARAPARGVDRVYRLSLSRDLFGVLVLEIAWGRRGAAGQVKRLAFDTLSEAHAEITARLRRRASAERRIGAGYHAIS
jgi:hypothetical protein